MDYKKLGTEALNRMLSDDIQELELQGLVDHHFRECYSLKEASGLSFFLDLIPIFFTDVRTIVTEMEKLLGEPIVDFKEMYSQCIKLKGSSACFGARQIKKVCTSLRHSIEKNSKDGCHLALHRLKNEYNSLQSHMDSIIKIEQEIISRAT